MNDAISHRVHPRLLVGWLARVLFEFLSILHRMHICIQGRQAMVLLFGIRLMQMWLISKEQEKNIQTHNRITFLSILFIINK